MKKALCIVLSVLICFSAAFIATSAQETTYQMGDVDLDGYVTILDATEIKLHLAKYVVLSNIQCELADVDSDGYLSIVDATKIQYYLADIIDGLPCPETQPTQPVTQSPTQVPTECQTLEPTEKQTETPTQAETPSPTLVPTECQTSEPTEKQTETPTQAETNTPIQGPTQPETQSPTQERPSKVANITYEVTYNSVTFTWDKIDSCTKFWAYRYNAATDTWAACASSTENTVTVPNLRENTTYSFKIIGKFYDGYIMALSDSDTVNVTTPQVPTSPPTTDPCITYAEKLETLQDDNTLTISMMSDVHYDKDIRSNQDKLDAIKALGKVQQMVDVDLTCVMGDILDGNANKETTFESMDILLDTYKNNTHTPLVVLRGNHDDNGWYSFGGFGGTYKVEEIINDEQWWNRVNTNLPEGFVIDENRPHGGYGYYDHEDTKTRIFMLNSSDIPYIEEEDGTYRYNGYQCFAYSNEQLNFVADALQFSDKENKDEWAALFLSHIPVETSNLDGERFGGIHALVRGSTQLSAIIESYRKGAFYSFEGSVYNTSSVIERPEDFMVSVDVDYTQKGQGEVIGFVSGHTHTDNYCDEVGGEYGLNYGYSYIGIFCSTTFANLVVNRENNTMTILKYGEGTPEKDAGVVKSDVDSGSIESGEWTIQYNPLAAITPKYVETSQIYPMYYNFDGVSGIDLETMEVISAVQVAAPRVLTKAVMVKPITSYVLPKDFSGLCLCYNKSGSKRTYLKPTDYGDYKMVTTSSSTRYLSFSFDTSFYPDYENFYIMELHTKN